ncbi:MAG TPA: RHS repeat-associated core domain-containing protein, partial [Parasegetibacter sp.]
LGSPRITTDENGQVISRRDFQPFGEEIATSQRTQGLGYAGDTVRQKFTSYERDIESDLDFAQARYYSSRLGRFYSVDPENAGASEEDPQSWNGYGYGRSNPVLYSDPDGLEYKICNKEGQCWYHPDSNFKKGQKQFPGLYQETDRDGHYDSGNILDSDGNVVGTYERISIDPEYQLVYGIAEQSKKKAKVVGGLAAGAAVVGACIGTGVCAAAAPAIIAGGKSLLKSTPKAISRLPRPPTPNNMNLGEFGRNVMKWGSRNADARARINTLTKAELQANGVTKKMAEAWRDFYINEAKRVPSNPSAAGRADLMQRAVDLLSK